MMLTTNTAATKLRNIYIQYQRTASYMIKNNMMVMKILAMTVA